MADDCPNKSDIESVFKRLRSIPANKSCFDCTAKNPTWASVTYGVFICIDCSAVHRGLGVHLSFVRSTQLDTHWTWPQIRNMQLGGNANASTFFRQHNCETTDAQVKYNSRAAQLYRDKLDTSSKQAMRLHGTKLHLDGGAASESHQAEEKKDSDFFDTIITLKEEDTIGFRTTSLPRPKLEQTLSAASRPAPSPSPAPAPASSKVDSNSSSTTDPNASPNVEGAFSSSNPASLSDHKSTIGRKIPARRSGLGAKKPGGLGAQKVKANFAEIEREAELADQLKESIENSMKQQAPVQPSTEEQDAKMVSMRLAYQDLGLQQKKEEEKLKQVDPKKAEQIERLGMGFSTRGQIQHSAISDMKIIKQDTPVKSKSSSSALNSMPASFKKVEQFSDSDLDFLLRSGFSSNWTDSESKSVSTWDRSTNEIDSMWKDNLSAESSLPKSASSSNRDKISSDWDTTSNDPVKSNNSWDKTSSNWDNSSSNWSKTADNKSNPTSLSAKLSKSNNTAIPAKTATPNSDALKKFASAKSISSAQYFSENVEDEKCNLSRFEGSTSISSAELFGGSSHQDYSSGYTPDLDDVKESLRQGATKVAGKLSSLANGVMSSIQEKYSGY